MPIQLFSSIVVLEGMSGAGKSSVIVSLYPELSSKFFVLPELNPEFSDTFKNKPLHEQTEDYYHLWLERMAIVNSSNLNFLFDRSYFGCLAFSYAMDRLIDTNFYETLLEKMQLSFDFQMNFKKIIVLDVDPLVSIERRKIGEMNNYWPWNTTAFLEHFREFYLLELPKLTTTPIEYINTTNITLSELKIIIKNKLGIEPAKAIFLPETQKNLLVNYIDANGLGRLSSSPIMLFGCPSIITETNCIQLDENNHPILLNNERLYYLLNLVHQNP